MSKQLGCLSPLGILAAVVVLAGLLVWALASGPVMFSPGPLNAVARAQAVGGVSSHAQLGGRCAACHTAPWGRQTMAERCIACHQDVGTQVRNRTGLHGGLMEATAASTCRGCHTEHRGPGAALTVLDASFPHDVTGYSLRGHQSKPGGGHGRVRRLPWRGASSC